MRPKKFFEEKKINQPCLMRMHIIAIFSEKKI